jgi:putative phage-type endonuclease
MIEQRSEEWHQMRLGKVTASRIADMMAKTKTGWGASRGNYAAELIAERLTGQRTEGYVSEAMQNGIDLEEEARNAYAFIKNAKLHEVAFVDHPSISMSGASPDRLVGDDGLIEIKCPMPKKHIATLLGGSIDGSYQMQMQWQMACTGRQWCDFVSYNPAMPEHLKLFVRRVRRDDTHISDLEMEVIKFLSEVEDKVAALNALQEAA